MKPVGFALLQQTRRRAQPQSKTRGAEQGTRGRPQARRHGRKPGVRVPAARRHRVRRTASPGIGSMRTAGTASFPPRRRGSDGKVRSASPLAGRPAPGAHMARPRTPRGRGDVDACTRHMAEHDAVSNLPCLQTTARVVSSITWGQADTDTPEQCTFRFQASEWQQHVAPRIFTRSYSCCCCCCYYYLPT